MKFKEILIAVCFILFGCQNQGKNYIGKYFDLKGFIQLEADRLNKENAAVVKEVSINEEIEKKKMGNVDWEKELEVFSEADINQPAFEGQYRVDTAFINRSKGTFSEINYSTSNTDLKTQSIKLYFLRNTDHVYKLEISRNVQNFLNDKKRTLEYISGHSFRIEQYQKIILMKPKKTIISGKITNKITD